MRSPFPWCGFCLLLTAALSFAADDKSAPKSKDKDAASAAEKDKLIHIGSVAGVVESSAGEDGLLKIKVTIRYLEPNVQAQVNLLKDEQQLMARQQGAMAIRNPIQRQQEYLRILQAAQGMGRENLFTLKEVKKDLAFETTEETKYRTAAPPTAFDDKGNPKSYTRAELKELKGQDNLPGYPAERDALHGGVTVVVSAALRRPAPGEKPLAEEKPIATLVLIAGEK